MMSKFFKYFRESNRTDQPGSSKTKWRFQRACPSSQTFATPQQRKGASFDNPLKLLK